MANVWLLFVEAVLSVELEVATSTYWLLRNRTPAPSLAATVTTSEPPRIDTGRRSTGHPRLPVGRGPTARCCRSVTALFTAY